MFNDRATELISQERRVYRHKRCQLKLEEVCYRGNTIRNSIKSRTFKLKINLAAIYLEKRVRQLHALCVRACAVRARVCTRHIFGRRNTFMLIRVCLQINQSMFTEKYMIL